MSAPGEHLVSGRGTPVRIASRSFASTARSTTDFRSAPEWSAVAFATAT